MHVNIYKYRLQIIYINYILILINFNINNKKSYCSYLIKLVKLMLIFFLNFYVFLSFSSNTTKSLNLFVKLKFILNSNTFKMLI